MAEPLPRTGKMSALPQWAQIEITTLRQEVEQLRAIKEKVSVPGADTLVRGIWPEADHGIGNGVPIRFRTHHGLIDARREDRDFVSIKAIEGTLLVLPTMANEIRVRVGDWF